MVIDALDEFSSAEPDVKKVESVGPRLNADCPAFGAHHVYKSFSFVYMLKIATDNMHAINFFGCAVPTHARCHDFDDSSGAESIIETLRGNPVNSVNVA